MPIKTINNPLFQATTSTGAPLSGGKLYTYKAGTSTLKATYSDIELSTAHPNPIILDSLGQATIYGEGAYKLNLTTSADVQVTGWPVDNVTGDYGGDVSYVNISDYAGDFAAAMTGIGATNTTLLINQVVSLSAHATCPDNVTLEFTRGGQIIGAYTLTINGDIIAGNWQIFGSTLTVEGVSDVNIVWYGATGDGSTDDRAAIQAAIDAVESTGHEGSIYFPPPDVYYLVSSTHPVETAVGLLIENSNIRFYGEWSADQLNASFLRCEFSSMQDAGLYVKGTCYGLIFERFAMLADNAASVAHLETTPSLTMRQCRFTSDTTTANLAKAPDAGLRIDRTWISILEGVYATAKTCFQIGDHVGTGGSTSITINSCYGTRGTVANWSFAYVHYSTLNSCAADGAGNPSWGVTPIAYKLFTCNNFTFNQSGCEVNNQALNAETCLDLMINGLYLSQIGVPTGSASPVRVIRLEGCSGMVSGIRFIPDAVSFDYQTGTNGEPRYYMMRAFTGENIAILDSEIKRKNCDSNQAAGNRNVFFISDTTQMRTQTLEQVSGTKINIPIFSQSSLWTPIMLKISGLRGEDSISSNPYPFSGDISFNALTTLANVAINNDYGITSATISGMNIVITLANAVDAVTFTIEEITRRVVECTRPELVDFDSITFTAP
jgi:hypothetical protein